MTMMSKKYLPSALLATAATALVCAHAFTASAPSGSASTALTSVVLTDRATVESPQKLAALSDVVAFGQFTAVVGTGLGSQFGMATAGLGDPQVEVWNFHVSRYLRGTGEADLRVVRYNSSTVTSGESTIETAVPALVFLSGVHGGARVVIGGDQGLAYVGTTGFTRVVGTQTVPGMQGSTVDAIAALVRP